MFTSIGAAEENLQIMLDTGVVAVIRTESSEQLLRVSQAIRVGGVRCVETAMTTPNALRVDRLQHGRLRRGGLWNCNP